MATATLDVDTLLDDFERSLAECAGIYRRGAQRAASSGAKLAVRLADLPRAMHDLHRALVLKVFLDVVHADREFGPGEQQLAERLARHVWGRELSRGEQRKLLARAESDVAALDWAALVAPFAELPELRGEVGSLQTVVMRMANLVAKIEGRAAPETMAQISMIQYALWQHLGRPPASPSDAIATPPIELADVSALPLPLGEGRGEGNPPAVSPAVGAVQKQTECPPAERLEDVLAELDGLVGLASIKREVRTLANYLKVRAERRRLGLTEAELTLHMVFSGNPGTGKTTVARLVGRILRAMGVLARGHLVETDRAGLVAEYAGQTAVKTHRKVDEALDGVLFIDEAYSLVATDGNDSYGDEAVQALLKRVEDDRSRLVVILAGYPRPLDELLATNPGLTSRFPRRLEFADYSADELCQIFARLCGQNHYELTPGAREKLTAGFERAVACRDEHFGNGRLARNIFEDAIRRMADRIAQVVPLTHELLTRIEAEDLVFEPSP